MEAEIEAPQQLEGEGPTSFELSNPARVVPAQRKYIQFLENSRWKPVRFQSAGIVVLRNTKTDEPVEYAFDDPKEEAMEDVKSDDAMEGEEPPPPEPFEYIPS
jgi:26S proteasome regulatory subunit N2